MESGFPWTQELDLVRQQAMRSVTRGLDTATLKLDLPFQEPGTAVIAASWFLLRGIELANVRCQDRETGGHRETPR